MRVYQVVVGTVVLGTLVPWWLHHQEHGVISVHQMAIAFFLWLNFIIALWEICLHIRIDRIEEDHHRFMKEYAGRPLDRVKDFFLQRLSFGEILSPTTWSQIWSSYSLFDPAYADRKSFGFWIDSGNGISTSITSIICLYGMTFQVIPPRAFGLILLISCYQMGYGALVYFWAYVFNKHYRGHTWANLAVFVGLSNGIWLFFPGWGIWAAIQMIYADSYAVFS